MSNGLKLLLLAAGTLVTCIVVTLAIHMARIGQVTGNKFTQRLNQFNQELDESSILMYDGLEVCGADVVNFMKQQLGEYLSTENAPIKITVVTFNSPHREYTYTNRENLQQIQEFTNVRYIHPLHKFVGKIVYNENKVIVQVIFQVI